MTTTEFLEILKIAGRLKVKTRHCYTEENRKESVADHTYRMALMAMLLSWEEEFAKVDMNKVIRMCLIHDLGEAFTGDIPFFDKTDADVKEEEKIFTSWVETFPESQKREWQELLREMEDLKTIEAKTYKALDKLEAVISHDESDIQTWIPLEYTLQFTYAVKNTAFSKYLTELREELDLWTRQKIEETEELKAGETGRDESH